MFIQWEYLDNHANASKYSTGFLFFTHPVVREYTIVMTRPKNHYASFHFEEYDGHLLTNHDVVRLLVSFLFLCYERLAYVDSFIFYYHTYPSTKLILKAETLNGLN
jgi:hypothetical protein